MVLFLALLGVILLYRLGNCTQVAGFYGGGSGGSDYGFFNWSLSPVVAKEEPAELLIEDTPCSTDFDCKTGHCGMFGMCTTGLSL
jgi:hypothetical protein